MHTTIKIMTSAGILILLTTSRILEHMPMRPGIIRLKSEERPNHPYKAPQDVRGSAISYAIYTFFYNLEQGSIRSNQGE
jgi:hypothetical protein